MMKVKSKSVLELGSGIGLVGIAASLLGANECILTDLPYTIDLMKRNIELNTSLPDRGTSERSTSTSNTALSCRLECRECDWFDPPPIQSFQFNSSSTFSSYNPESDKSSIPTSKNREADDTLE